MYKVVLAVIALRAQGAKSKAIAETLGYGEETIRQYVSYAYKRGWINIGSFSDVDDQLEYVLKHKVVENIHAVLGERTEDGHVTAGAREVTLEAAKGLGMFKTHQVVKNDTQIQAGFALKVQVEMPPMQPAQQNGIVVRAGTVGGAAATGILADAEIVEPTEE
jgi:DNA-binding transcriptional regulator LsrR (DeoR family)